MARAIWKGSISFGLVNIPIGLFSAEKPDELSFRQLDKSTLSPIGYKKYNKQTGEEVNEIVKGYEYESDHYVVLSDEDLRRANPEKTQTVEITDFVELDEIEPLFYDKPYYLAPVGKGSNKGYALLREAMRRSGKVGIAKVVIRSREHLAAVIPVGHVLILEILRYPNEIRTNEDLDVPAGDAAVSERELEMAQMLIDGMTSKWEPEKYHDAYRDDLMALIQRRIESGQTEQPDETPVEVPEPRADVIDIMSLLKRSVEATTGGKSPGAKSSDARPSSDKPAPSKAVDEEVEEEDELPALPAARSKPKSAAARAKPRSKQRKSA